MKGGFIAVLFISLAVQVNASVGAFDSSTLPWYFSYPGITFFGLLGSLLFYAAVKLRTRRIETRNYELEAKIREQRVRLLSIDPAFVGLRQRLENTPIEELLESMDSRVRRTLQASSEASSENLKREIARELQAFKDRISKIEGKFPDSSSIDKVASINDALLAQAIDQLKDRIERLEQKNLSRWDVGAIFGILLSGIAAVVAATWGIIHFVQSYPAGK